MRGTFYFNVNVFVSESGEVSPGVCSSATQGRIHLSNYSTANQTLSKCKQSDSLVWIIAGRHLELLRAESICARTLWPGSVETKVSEWVRRRSTRHRYYFFFVWVCADSAASALGIVVLSATSVCASDCALCVGTLRRVAPPRFAAAGE